MNVPAVGHLGPPRLTAGLDRFEWLDRRAHLAVHGELRPLDLEAILDLAERIGLRGRGGAGFPCARKLHAVARSAQRRDLPVAVVVNGTEGEPASWHRAVRGVLPLPAGENSTAGRLVVDWSRCDGHGLCAQLAPELITLDTNGYPSLSDTPVPPWLASGARKAIAMCPALALRQDT